MPELDDDDLRARLRDLYESALPAVRPPGIDAARRRVRRETALRFATVLAAACAAMVSIMLIVPWGRPTPPPIDDPTASPTPGPSPSTSTSGTPTASPSISEDAGQSTPCDSNPRVGFSYNPPTVSFWLYSPSGAPVCPGIELKFSWVSFMYYDDGKQRLYGGATWPVRTGITFSDTIPIHPTCQGDIYLAAGAFSETVLEPGMHHPFPIASAANNWQGTVYSSIVESSPCVSPPPTQSSLPSPPTPST